MKPKFIFLLLLLLSFACETERILFKSGYHVRFTNSELTIKESTNETVKIEVHLAGTEREEDLTIGYKITGNALEGIDYQIVGTDRKVVIEEGDYFGYIEIEIINNANNVLRSQFLEFTLTTVNADGLLVGQEGGIGTKFKLTILDDCILSGTYSGSQSALSIPTRGISITSSDCDVYRLSNWNIDVFNFSDPIPLTFVDNADNTLTIKSQEVEGFPSNRATIQGTGSVNPATKEITMNVTLVDFDGSPVVTFKLKPE